MSKALKITIIALLLVASFALSFGTGCAPGSRTPPSSSQGLDIVAEAWNVIFEDYVDKEVFEAIEPQ